MADTTRIRTNAPSPSVTRLELRLSIAGDVPKQANFVSGSGVTSQCGRKFSQTNTAPAIAPNNCARAKGASFEKSPVLMATPKVTAGLRCASGLPQAMAVNTPVITAKAHPAVIASHPPPSALLRLSNMLATAPLPIRMRTIVPMNSPKNLDAIGSSWLAGTCEKTGWQAEAPAPHYSQSNDRVTAFFQNAYNSWRRADSICGFQVWSTLQRARRSSISLKNPTASPAA